MTPSACAVTPLLMPTFIAPTFERIRHMHDSRDQILVLAVRLKSSKRFTLCPFRSEVIAPFYLTCCINQMV